MWKRKNNSPNKLKAVLKYDTSDTGRLFSVLVTEKVSILEISRKGYDNKVVILVNDHNELGRIMCLINSGRIRSGVTVEKTYKYYKKG